MNNKLYFWLTIFALITFFGFNMFSSLSPKPANAGCVKLYLKSALKPNPGCGGGTALGGPVRTSIASAYGGGAVYVQLCSG